MSLPTPSRIPMYRGKAQRTPGRASHTQTYSSRPYNRESLTASIGHSSRNHYKPTLDSANRRPPHRSSSASYRAPPMHEEDSDGEGPYELAVSRFRDVEPPSAAHGARHIRDRVAPSTPVRSFRTPDRGFRKSAQSFWTPDRGSIRGEHGSISSNHQTHFRNEHVAFDEEIIAKTPAKDENDEWLASLGIDLSLLKLTSNQNDLENQNPNAAVLDSDNSSIKTPSRPTTGSVPALPKALMSVYEEARSSALNSYDAPRDHEVGIGRPSGVRRHTDLQASNSVLTRGDSVLESVTPSRVKSARKSRRASARVSARELRGLIQSQDNVMAAAELDVAELRRSARKVNRRSMRIQSDLCELGGQGTEPVETTGATVMLSPVRATKQQKEALGSERVVTPVRRSLRISQRHMPAVQFPDLGEQNAERLDSANYAYLPNPSLEGKLASERRTPLH